MTGGPLTAKPASRSTRVLQVVDSVFLFELRGDVGVGRLGTAGAASAARAAGAARAAYAASASGTAYAASTARAAGASGAEILLNGERDALG